MPVCAAAKPPEPEMQPVAMELLSRPGGGSGVLQGVDMALLHRCAPTSAGLQHVTALSSSSAPSVTSKTLPFPALAMTLSYCTSRLLQNL